MRFTRTAMGLALGAVVFAGCSSSRAIKVPQVEDSWLARVPAERLEPVYEARTHVRRAEDDVARAKAQLTDATNMERVASAQLEAARREVDVAKANLKVASETGQRDAVDRAERQQDVAKLAVKTAEKKQQLAEQRVEAAELQLELEQAQVDGANVALARSEYEVLRQQGDTRVEAYAPAEYERAAATASAREAEASRDYRKKLEQVNRAEAEYEQSRMRLRAARSATPSIG